MVVTPETAKEWLEKHNTANRNMSRSKVAQYARDMCKGNWTASHQGIGFYEDGALSDGQHRLQACFETAIPLETFVTFGIPREAASGIDCHRARRMDDQIKIAGLADWIGQSEIAIAKLCRRMSANGIRNSGTMSSHEAVEFCNKHKQAIIASTSAISKKARYLSAAPIFVAMACAYEHVGIETLARFGRVLQTGIPETKDEVAAIRLRERLLHSGNLFCHSDNGRIEAVKLCMRAIKAFHDKEQIGKLMMPAGYIYPPLS